MRAIGPIACDQPARFEFGSKTRGRQLDEMIRRRGNESAKCDKLSRSFTDRKMVAVFRIKASHGVSPDRCKMLTLEQFDLIRQSMNAPGSLGV